MSATVVQALRGRHGVAPQPRGVVGLSLMFAAFRKTSPKGAAIVDCSAWRHAPIHQAKFAIFHIMTPDDITTVISWVWIVNCCSDNHYSSDPVQVQSSI